MQSKLSKISDSTACLQELALADSLESLAEDLRLEDQTW